MRVALAPDVPDEPLVPRRPPRELARVHREGVAVLGRGHGALAVGHLESDGGEYGVNRISDGLDSVINRFVGGPRNKYPGSVIL